MQNAEFMDVLLRMQLVDARQAKHLTQKEVAQVSGLSESTISMIESIKSNTSPTLRSLIKYADAVGVNMYIGYENKNNSTEE